MRATAGLIAILALGVHAPARANPSDVSITTIGASGTWSAAVEEGELDLLVGERMRWTLSDGKVGSRLLVDARFTFDPLDEDDVLRWQQLRQLGVSLEAGEWTVDLGRNPVRYGGPRLVDGVQALRSVGHAEIGVWGGLAPDLFSTLPRLRFGGGPILAYTRSATQLSLVGEALLTDAGDLDRTAVLATGRTTLDRILDVSGRADLELTSPEGPPHLSDAQVLVIARPTGGLRFDALYNAFSSYRYLQTESLDPELQRFQARILQLGIDLGITQETRDPSINHLVGGGVRVLPETSGVQPRLAVDGRYRFNPNPANRFARIHPQLGLGQIPFAGVLDVALDGNVIHVDDDLQYDGGVVLFWEPGDDPAFALDTSGRVLVNPADYDGLGWYADLFVDWILPIDLALVAGASVINEPYEALPDLGVSGFLRITKYLRPPRD